MAAACTSKTRATQPGQPRCDQIQAGSDAAQAAADIVAGDIEPDRGRARPLAGDGDVADRQRLLGEDADRDQRQAERRSAARGCARVSSSPAAATSAAQQHGPPPAEPDDQPAGERAWPRRPADRPRRRVPSCGRAEAVGRRGEQEVGVGEGGDDREQHGEADGAGRHDLAVAELAGEPGQRAAPAARPAGSCARAAGSSDDAARRGQGDARPGPRTPRASPGTAAVQPAMKRPMKPPMMVPTA